MLKKKILSTPTRIINNVNYSEFYWPGVKVIVEETSVVRARLIYFNNVFNQGDIVDDDDLTQQLVVEYQNENVEIDLVYIKTKSGICTKAVGLTMLALMLYLKDRKIKTGDVFVYSSEPIAAFVCYCQAFLSNGFYVHKYSDTEKTIEYNIDQMVSRIKQYNVQKFHITFQYIGNLTLRF